MRTKTVTLNSDKSLGFGAMVKHCNTLQPINYHEMNSGDWWECAKCNKPLVLITDEGWYEVGNLIQF